MKSRWERDRERASALCTGHRATRPEPRWREVKCLQCEAEVLVQRGEDKAYCMHCGHSFTVASS